MFLTYQDVIKMGGENSIHHKLKRIKRQELFRENHQSAFNSLTKRELQIVTLLANGKNNPQIANDLFISRFTVEQHRKNINRKLHINSITELYRYALAFDLV